MTIERSRGKARPTLPRSSDLGTVSRADGERSARRTENGRFATGNESGRGRGWKQACARLIGREEGDEDAKAVAKDAWQIFAASIREMPSDGATVRGLLAMKARHEALAAFWVNQAARLGLASEGGVKAQEQASKNGQRAERLAVTALDVAKALATAKPKNIEDEFPWFRGVTKPAEPTPDEEEEDDGA